MSGIFITYRRSDTAAWAGRLHDSLKQHFPGIDIFMDVEAIPPGSKFSEYIRDAVGSCDVLFVLIGPQWLTAIDEDGKRRLDEEEDLVSLEIEAALEREVPIIPTLVGEATMPRKQDLPEHLKPLCDYQNFVISDRSWHDDCARLVKNIEGIVGERSAESETGNRSKMVIAGIAAVAVLCAALIFWYHSSVRPPDSPGDTPPAASILPEEPGPTRSAGTNASAEPGASRPSTTTTTAEPVVNEPTEPATPQQRSLFDAGLEGKWELVDAVGKKMPKEKIVVELARSGNTMRIVILPDKQNLLLHVKPDKMTLILPDNEGYVNLKRASSQQQNRWSVSAVNKSEHASSGQVMFKGWVKISADWHIFDGVLTEPNATQNQTAFSMRIDQGERKGEVTLGAVNKAPELIFKFRKR